MGVRIKASFQFTLILKMQSFEVPDSSEEDIQINVEAIPAPSAQFRHDVKREVQCQKGSSSLQRQIDTPSGQRLLYCSVSLAEFTIPPTLWPNNSLVCCQVFTDFMFFFFFNFLKYGEKTHIQNLASWTWFRWSQFLLATSKASQLGVPVEHMPSFLHQA